MGNIPLKREKRGWSVNYLVNLGAECHFSKIGYSESSFPKKKDVSVIYPKYNLFLLLFLFFPKFRPTYSVTHINVNY